MTRNEDILGRLVLDKDDKDYLHEVAELDSKPYLAAAGSLGEALKEQLRTPVPYLKMPFKGNSILRFARGRWTIWSGPTFSGKTQMLRAVILNAIYGNDEKALFASLEESPLVVLKEMVALSYGQRIWTPDAIDEFLDVYGEKLWIFKHSGFVAPEIVMGAIIYCAKHFGCTQFVVDSLMMLDIRKDDFEGQKELGALLNRVTEEFNIHIHIVVHPRKGEISTGLMDMYDIQGAQELVALAHSVVTTQRAPPFSMPKEREKWGLANSTATAILRVWKQRGDWDVTGMMELWYIKEARQWATHADDSPQYFMPYESFNSLGIRGPAPEVSQRLFE